MAYLFDINNNPAPVKAPATQYPIVSSKYPRSLFSINKLKYFSTTTATVNNLKPKINNKNKVKTQIKKSKVTNNNNLTINNSKALTLNKYSYNLLRGASTNYFRYYYYNRSPMIFHLYPFVYKRWMRILIMRNYNRKGKRLWRKSLYYMKRRLKRFQYVFRKTDRKLKNFTIKFQKLVTTNKNYQINIKRKNRNTLRWEKVMKFKYEKQQRLLKYYKKSVKKYNKFILYTPKANKVGYMRHIKFYQTQQMYYKFRFYVYSTRYFKRFKWIAKKRLARSVKTKIFRSYYTSLYNKKRVPYRFRKHKRAYKYKHFSYYWLRYFFKRFKTMYIENNKNQMNYKDIQKYLLCWLKKVRTYKYMSLHGLNPARGFLIYKSIKLHSELKQYSLYNNSIALFYNHDRNEIDDMFKSIVRKKRYLYRNFYWRYYKSSLERRKLQVLKRHYQFTWGLRPYIFVHKKHKVFYNWADRHIFKRYPLYRYKYTAFFKFPRFADYRRLFKNQLREQHVFRYLYRFKLSQLIKAFRKSTYKTKRIFELMFLKYFELRLDTVVYRLNFAWSLKHARQLVLRGLFVVNNKIIDNNKYHVGLGDVIMPVKRLRMQPLSKKYVNYIDNGLSLSWMRLFYRPIQSDQYPSHFLLNERIPAGMVVNKFNPNTLRYNKPFSVQFLTLSLLKYN